MIVANKTIASEDHGNGEDAHMAYAQSGPGSRRAAVVVTVAALHAGAFYALVTGLGIEYVERIVPGITGRNIPIEPPPPPPEPEITPSQAVQEPSVVTVPPSLPRVQRPEAPVFEVPQVVPRVPVLITPPSPKTLDIVRVPQPEPSRIAPKPARPRNAASGWVSTDDYPAAALRRGEQGTVRFDLMIGSNGKVEDCRVTASSGSSALDGATCKYVTARARFEPATDGTGARSQGSYSSAVTWVIPD